MKAKVSAVIAALAGVLVWQLGLFDRPKFEHQETFLPRELYAIVAVTKGDVRPKVFEKLITGTLKGIESLPDSTKLLESAVKIYPGTPEGAEKLALSVYFDDPVDVKKEEQRWAIGWFVESPKGNYGSIHALVDKVQEASGLTETIRAIRFGKGSVLKVSIPWRNFFTPMIQPMIQWTRGFATYEQGGYNDSTVVYKNPIALEVYVTVGPTDSYDHIDYVVLFGNTKTTWEDCFPVEHAVDAIMVDE